eukprot:423852_1
MGCILNRSEQSLSYDYGSIEDNYFPKNGYPVSEFKLEPIARVLLMGVYDDNNILSTFRGMRYIIKEIWQLTLQFNKHHYAAYIEVKTTPLFGSKPDHWNHSGDVAFNLVTSPTVCYWPEDDHQQPINYQELKLPKPLKKEININMMPVEMNYETLHLQLPKQLNGYTQLLRACLQADPSQRNTICFVTIHESFVEKGKTQRRPGLHIEYPGNINTVGGESSYFHGWGGGYYQRDGIFMASNISDSCVAWNCKIVSHDENEVIDDLGNIEHLKSMLPKDQKYTLERNKLYWITDRTPHEALAMNQSGWRQFFRLVSSKLGVWYENHSTKNPNGIVPNPKFTKIIKGNKFNK